MRTLATILLTICTLPAMAQFRSEQSKPTTSQSNTSIDSNLMDGRPGGIYKPKPSPGYTKYQLPAKAINPPTYLIDSTIVNITAPYLNYISPNDILAINVVREKPYPNGAIYITLKDHKLFIKLQQSKLLSLHDITNRYIDKNEKHQPVIYLLDKELLTDTTDVRIPEMCLINVTVAKASETPYFKTALPDVILMMITTRPASIKPYEPPIFIRGLTSDK